MPRRSIHTCSTGHEVAGSGDGSRCDDGVLQDSLCADGIGVCVEGARMSAVNSGRYRYCGGTMHGKDYARGDEQCGATGGAASADDARYGECFANRYRESRAAAAISIAGQDA